MLDRQTGLHCTQKGKAGGREYMHGSWSDPHANNSSVITLNVFYCQLFID